MFAGIVRKVWRIGLILRPFGFGAPGSLKIGEFSSLWEVERASTLVKRDQESVSD